VKLRLFGWTINVWVEAFCESFTWLPYWAFHAYDKWWADYLGWQRGGCAGWLILDICWLAAQNDWVAEKIARRKARCEVA
jgi:hypothetical protein